MTANFQQPPQQQQNIQVSSQFLVEQQMDTVADIHHWIYHRTGLMTPFIHYTGIEWIDVASCGGGDLQQLEGYSKNDGNVP